MAPKSLRTVGPARAAWRGGTSRKALHVRRAGRSGAAVKSTNATLASNVRERVRPRHSNDAKREIGGVRRRETGRLACRGLAAGSPLGLAQSVVSGSSSGINNSMKRGSSTNAYSELASIVSSANEGTSSCARRP